MSLELHISKRLKALLPAQTDQERKQLEENIESDGKILNDLIYWNDGKRNLVVDGMNRFDIARKRNLSFGAEEMPFDSIEDVEAWIWNHQAGQRNLTRETIGKWYNSIKATQGGDHTSKVHNDTSLGDAAQKIAEKTGKSPRTVKRHGARAKTIEDLTSSAQKMADKATDAEVKRLAKLEPSDQNKVARVIRGDSTLSVSEAIKEAKVTPAKAEKPAPSKPPKKFDRPACFKRWEQAIGPIVRLVEKIADDVGEKNGSNKEKMHDKLEACTQFMAKWMGVEL